MAEEKKTSDAVRITRIVAPTILIIALALIFKSELSNTMAGGCYEIELIKVGAVSDKSMCSKKEIEDVLTEVSTIAIEENRESAEQAMQEMEDMLGAMEEEIRVTKQEAIELAQQTNMFKEQTFELAYQWEKRMHRIESPEVKRQVGMFYNQFVEMFEVPSERVEIASVVVEPLPEIRVQQASSEIRQRYIKNTEAEVTQIRNNITVKRK